MAPQSVPNWSSSDFGSGFVMKQWKCINRRRSRLCLRRLSLYAFDLKRTKTRRGVACLAPPKTAVAIVVIRPGRPPPVRELIGPPGDCSIEIRADWCSTMSGIASRIVEAASKYRIGGHGEQWRLRFLVAPTKQLRVNFEVARKAEA
jgi:hypothetical protein